MRYATAALFLMIFSVPAFAEGDILFVGRLDRDAWADTVVGIPTGDLRMLATAIHWGAPYSSNDGREDARRTRLLYPDWPRLEGSCAVEDVNNDGVDDLLLFFGDAGASDSSRAIALLGQEALRTITAIELASIRSPMQRHPFVAVDVGSVDLLVERAQRELSGVPSYRWGHVAVRTHDTAAAIAPPPILAEWMALYPNPASAAATLEARRLAPGSYTVELVDMEGTIHHERRLHVERERSLSSTLDLSDQPPGLYLVRIRRAGELVASYPVVVVR